MSDGRLHGPGPLLDCEPRSENDIRPPIVAPASASAASAVGYHPVAPEPPGKVSAMPLNSPTDRTLFSVVARYEQEVMGPRLTDRQLTRIAEAVKRLLFDEIHSAKAAAG